MYEGEEGFADIVSKDGDEPGRILEILRSKALFQGKIHQLVQLSTTIIAGEDTTPSLHRLMRRSIHTRPTHRHIYPLEARRVRHRGSSASKNSIKI